MENWLVIVFLSREKSHAKQIFLLSSALKLGPNKTPDEDMTEAQIKPHMC